MGGAIVWIPFQRIVFLIQGIRALACVRAPEVFYKYSVLRSFATFPGKQPWQRLWYRCFHVNYRKFLRPPFYRTPSNDCFWL